MDEPRWFNSAEEYRTVQLLVREGRYREAVERARLALAEGCLGRKHAARLHSQVCWLHAEHLPINPAAVLHGEEAVRLAVLVSDEWIQTEALARLVHANCRLGDLGRAHSALQEVARKVEANDGALVGGMAALRQLEATVAAAGGDEARCLQLLEQAEALAGRYPPAVGAKVRLQRVGALLEYGHPAEARRLLSEEPAVVEDDLEWELAHAWLAVFDADPAEANARLRAVATRASEGGRPAVAAVCLGLRALAAERMQNGEAAAGLAQQALWQSITLGRTDLVRRLRSCLNRLLPA